MNITRDIGADLNAQAGALEEALFERSEEIDQLTEVFVTSGLTVGGIWYNIDDAYGEFYGSAEYDDWLSRSKQPEMPQAKRAELVAEYEKLMHESLRRYVADVLDPLLTQEMMEDAA